MTKKLSTPFAINSSLRNDVPVKATSEQTAKGIIGYTDGWTAINKLPVDNGGQAPWMEDINGVLYDVTGNISDINKGLPQYFDTDFATSIGGYPIGARLCLDDNSEYVVSTIASNSNNPNSNMTGWKKTNFNEYDFKVAQPIQYYYDILGDWNDAIEQAQLNIFTKGYSPKLILPAGEVLIKRPIWGGASLGMYLHEKYPDLGIYNATTNTFKMTPDLVIEGQGRGLTTITFAGSKGTADPHDLTWVNYGAINTTPYKPLEQCSGKATVFYHTNWWTRVNLKGFTIQGVNTEANGIRPPVHGITLFRGHRGFIDDVMVVGFTGAGILCDGYYDSFFKEFEIFQSGRMSPVYAEYLDKGLTTLDYQTYAPLHIMNSDIGDGWDNCNFLRFLNFHIEDCFHSVTDVIVSGKSSPIWLENMHFECDNTEGTGKLGNKIFLAIGSYGVSRFSQDGVDGYVYGSEKFTGTGGGYVYWTGGSGYEWNYGEGITMGDYSQLNITNLVFPSGLNVKIDGGNAPSKLVALNCNFGDVKNNANAAQIELDGCSISSYTQTYGLCPVMQNTVVAGAISIQNSISNISQRLVLNNVVCSYATVTVDFGSVLLNTTSTDTPTTLYIARGESEMIDNYVLNTLGVV